MPDASPEHIEAINRVIEEKDPRAEWGNDQMRSALLDVAGGDSMGDAAEGRDFTKGTLSDVHQKVEDLTERLAERRESSEGFFEDPVEEAVEGVQDFFDRMEENYGVAVNNIAVQLLTDEIRDAEQLPTAHDFSRFLQSVNAGVGEDKIWLLTRRYDSWLQSFEGDQSGGGFADMGFSMSGGHSVSGGNQGVPSFSGRGQEQSRDSVLPGGEPQEQRESNDRVDRLEQRVEELTEAIREDQQDGSDEGQITIERDNGPNVTLPANHPAVHEMMGSDDGSDSPDFMEMLQQAKDAGLVVGPDELREMQSDEGGMEDTIETLQTLGVLDMGSDNEMAEAIQSAISDLGQKQLQAQQQMSQNFQSVVEQMKEMQEEDDEDISSEEIVDRVVDELSEDEVDQLRSEMDEKFEQVMEKVDERRRRSNRGEQDPEFLKTDREMEFREQQLEMLNENLRVLPSEVAKSVRDGLVPALREVDSFASGSSVPGFDPRAAAQAGKPDYRPEMPDEDDDRNPTPERDYPEPKAESPSPQDDTESDSDDDSPGGVTKEQIEDIRSRLNLADSDEEQEVPA